MSIGWVPAGFEGRTGWHSMIGELPKLFPAGHEAGQAAPRARNAPLGPLPVTLPALG